jgi:hypothetical protein
MVSGRQKDARAHLSCGIACALLLAGTAGAQDKIEIRFGTTNPPVVPPHRSVEIRIESRSVGPPSGRLCHVTPPQRVS